ncbi:MAG: heme-copper oxidase subunit III [Flavisolibacter sp.]
MSKLMMKLTIGSEAVFFICLLVAYLYFWRAGNFQKEATEHLHIKTTALFSIALLSSSFTFYMAERRERKQQGSGKIWLLVTILLGLIFLSGQGHEYYRLIEEKLLISKNEFGSSFYTLTGFHGLHVLIGLIILCIAFSLIWKGTVKNNISLLQTIGIYWHFVDIVWIFVFTTIYVLPYLV